MHRKTISTFVAAAFLAAPLTANAASWTSLIPTTKPAVDQATPYKGV